MNADPVTTISEHIRSSPKYKTIDRSLIRRLIQFELAKGRAPKEAEAAVRSKLHQITGAYFSTPPRYSNWLTDLGKASQGGPAAFQAACAWVLSSHSSTRERLDGLERFWQRVFCALPTVTNLLDVACGFGPLSLPWMLNAGLPKSVSYQAVDIHSDLIDFLNRFFLLAGIQGRASLGDVSDETLELPSVDLALVLKAIPCLEQIHKDAGANLLRRLEARWILVTYPTASLGGRNKGMQTFYAEAFTNLLNRAFPGQIPSYDRLDIPGELVFLIEKNKLQHQLSFV